MPIVLLVVAFMSVLIPGQDRGLPEDLNGDPHAIYLYGQMMGTVQGAKSLAFESSHEMYSVKDGEKRYPSIMSYKAWLMKPNRARLEVSALQFEPMGILVGDGEYFWSYWPNGTWFFTTAYRHTKGALEHNVYMRKRTPQGMHSLAHEICYIGTGSMSIFELSSFHGYVESMTDYLQEIKSQGEEKVGEELCDVIHLSFMNGQRERTLWISKKDHIPRKLKSAIHVSYDIFIEEEWTNIRINDQLDTELFRWQPPEGWEERQMPSPDDALLSKGDSAPNFSLRDAKDRKISLSDYHGKPVWLMFWRVG